MLHVSIIRLDPDLALPGYAHTGDAGLDLCAREDGTISPAGGRLLMPTGIAIAIPSGYAGFVLPRSGLALKHGIGLVNSPGTIDADYRGEVRVLLVNLSNEPFVVNDGERIAQLIVAKHETIAWQPTTALSETQRGAGGYGSTGKQ